MKLLYFPLGGSIIDSVNNSKEFDNFDDLVSHVVFFSKCRFYISVPEDVDSLGVVRYSLCVFMKGFEYPQCVGFVSFDVTKFDLLNSPAYKRFLERYE